MKVSQEDFIKQMYDKFAYDEDKLPPKKSNGDTLPKNSNINMSQEDFIKQMYDKFAYDEDKLPPKKSNGDTLPKNCNINMSQEDFIKQMYDKFGYDETQSTYPKKIVHLARNLNIDTNSDWYKLKGACKKYISNNKNSYKGYELLANLYEMRKHYAKAYKNYVRADNLKSDKTMSLQNEFMDRLLNNNIPSYKLKKTLSEIDLIKNRQLIKTLRRKNIDLRKLAKKSRRNNIKRLNIK
jgi:hypothetical protein